MTKGGGKDETGKYRKLKTLDEIVNQLEYFEDITDPEPTRLQFATYTIPNTKVLVTR